MAYGRGIIQKTRVWTLGAEIVETRPNLQITREIFDLVLRDPEVQRLLADLDISVTNHRNFFDALDANGNGILDIAELIDGLLMLRGPSDKTDVVAALLGIRAVRTLTMQVKHDIKASSRVTETRLSRLEDELGLRKGQYADKPAKSIHSVDTATPSNMQLPSRDMSLESISSNSHANMNDSPLSPVSYPSSRIMRHRNFAGASMGNDAWSNSSLICSQGSDTDRVVLPNPSPSPKASVGKDGDQATGAHPPLRAASCSRQLARLRCSL